MDTVVACEQVRKRFGENRRYVLDGVTLAISRGEFVSIMGPSGSGKSTLLFTLSGMDRVDGGKVVFGGVDFATLTDNALSDTRRKQMGFVFQQPTLLRNMNILDNIMLPAARDNRGNRGEIAAKARRLMERMGIHELEDRHITQASGGQLQRAGICRALINDPHVIFGDEPTGALDSATSGEIMELLAEIHRAGTTLVLVSHDVRVSARAERVMFLIDGKLAGECLLGMFDGTAESLKLREERLTAWLAGMEA